MVDHGPERAQPDISGGPLDDSIGTFTHARPSCLVPVRRHDGKALGWPGSPAFRGRRERISELLNDVTESHIDTGGSQAVAGST